MLIRQWITMAKKKSLKLILIEVPPFFADFYRKILEIDSHR